MYLWDRILNLRLIAIPLIIGVDLLLKTIAASVATTAIVYAADKAITYANQQIAYHRQNPSNISDSLIYSPSNQRSSYAAYKTKQAVEKQQGKRKKLKPDITAEGDHSVVQRDPETDKLTHYETYKSQKNPRDPKEWEFVKRYDDTGDLENSHFNKYTKKEVYEPHVHDPKVPGGIREPFAWEMPKF